MLEITVKTLDSNNHSFTLADEATVLQLKESIFEKIEVPISSQRLIYHGKVLRDEKKLTEYGDVNGKVIHLVERPPPSSSRSGDSTPGRRSESTAQGGGSNRRFPRRDGPPGFLGSMTFPAIGIGDFVEGVDIPVRPSPMMARNRLECASRMIGYARQSIRHMADPSNPPPYADMPRQARRQASTRASSSGPSTANRGTSTNASQAAQSAEPSDANNIDNPGNMVMADIAMIAEVLTGQVTGNGHVTIRRQRFDDNQRRDGLPPDVVTAGTFHEDIASEVEIGDTASSEADSATEVRDNSSENRPTGARPDNRARVDAMVPLLTDLEGINTELQPYLARCRELLSSDTTFDENSNPTQRDATRIFTGVTEALHSIAHASHALSDLMVDFNEDAPRFLRCRPVVLQHSTIVEAGIPMGMAADDIVVRTGEDGPRPGDARPRVNLATAFGASRANMPATTTAPTSTPTTSASSTTTASNNSTTRPYTVTVPVVSMSDLVSQMSGTPRESRGPFTTIEALPGLEVFFDYRRSDRSGSEPASGAVGPQPPEGPQPPPTPNNATGQDVNSRYGQMRDSFISFLGREPALAAQAAALASTANLWPNSNNGENDPDDSLPEIRPTELDAVLNSQSWSTRPLNTTTTNTTSTGINAAPEQTATGSQTTPPRRTGVSPMLNMMNMIFQQNFDPALPCSSHHIRSPRRIPQPNRMLWEMLPTIEAPTVRIITRLGGPSRTAPDGGNTPATENNTNQPPPTPDATQQTLPNSNIRRLLIDLITADADGMLITPNEELFTVEGASNGASLIRDFIRIMLRQITPRDLGDIAAARYSNFLNRLRPALRDFVLRHFLQDEDPTPEAMTRACDRLFLALRPYIETMQVTRFRETVDLSATINNYNQAQLPDIVDIILAPDNSSAVDFGTNLMARVTLYLRQLFAIIIYCCVDSNDGLDTVVRNWVRLLTQDAPATIRQWTELHSVNNMNVYAAELNILPEQIQGYIVHRQPGTTPVTPAPAQEPMETDGTASPAPVVANEEPVRNQVVLDTENLPEVLMGSEPWHNSVPSEWVPVIARDTQRQRRQSSQKPLSDAYMSGMPPKRRKLIATTKPQGETLPQAISEGVRHAIQAAGVSSPIAERAIAEAGHDRSLQKAYKMQEKATVGPLLSEDPDFSPTRFPNAHSFFKK